MASTNLGYIPKSIAAGYITGTIEDAHSVTSPTARNATASLTNAEVALDVQNGIVTSTTAAATALTLGTTTAGIISSLGTPPAGSTYKVKYINTGSSSLTLTQGHASTVFHSAAGASAASLVIPPGRSADTLWVISASSIAIYATVAGPAPLATVTISDDKTLTAAESGTTFLLNAAAGKAITLPASPTAGTRYTFYVAAAFATTAWTITAGSAIIRAWVIHATSFVDTNAAVTTITMDAAKETIGNRIDIFCPDGTNWSAQCYCITEDAYTLA